LKKKILITGGTGFLGRNLIIFLKKKKKFKIFSLSSKKKPKIKNLSNVKYIYCKLENKKDLKKKLNFDVEYIINFAGYVDHSMSKKTLNSHYIGLKNLAEIYNKKKIKKFIQIGSSVEYGFLNSPQKENNVLSPKKLKSVYGKAKLMATNFLIKLYKKNNFPVLILRPYLIYGQNQNSSRLIPTVINNCLNNSSFNCSNGNQIRNFMYVDDFVKIIYKSISLKINGEVINIGSSKNYPVKFIINSIQRIIGKGAPIFGKIKLRKDEPLKLYPSLLKFKNLIGTSKETKIILGLKKTINFYKKK
tara:strand:+ start:20679 stop:21587 length:909 start_codon:yes stop_codon:yes gene_type:complete